MALEVGGILTGVPAKYIGMMQTSHCGLYTHSSSCRTNNSGSYHRHAPRDRYACVLLIMTGSACKLQEVKIMKHGLYSIQ